MSLLFSFRARSIQAVAIALCVVGVSWTTVMAQDAPEGPAATATGQAGPAGQAFQQALASWKQLLTELRDIQTKYQVAEEGELEGLRKQWDDRMTVGNQMIADLRAKAIAAFQEAPNSNRELNQFLIKLLADEIKRDSYEPAWELSQILSNGKCDEKELDDLAGIAAFTNNEYDKAAQYFAAAKANGKLSNQGSNFESLVAEYKTYWEEERALREAEATADDLPRVQFTTTEGDIVLEMFENEAPETVGNFISLVKNGYYNGLSFHRVISGFMAQGGCPKGDGSGGPGYTIYCECKKKNYRKHFRGSLSMAKTELPDTGGSQFFLTFVPTSHLNGQHTVFGRVYSGMDVLAKIQKLEPGAPAEMATKIEKATVLRDRGHEYVPNKVK